MDTINWFDVIPSTMSAIATAGAAFAAFESVRVSKAAKLMAEQSTLAVHHGGAAIALAAAVETLRKSTEAFYETAYDTWVRWPSEIEGRDHRAAGGSNPRPLRHVLSNASEMLVNYGTGGGAGFRRAQRSMFALVRDGVNNLNDAEYESLLKRVDGTYPDFESVLGRPSPNELIGAAPAFRWAFYQLTRRVTEADWRKIFEKAWQEGGWLAAYRSAHSNLKPTLASIIASLNSERAKLSHSVIPLESNPSLFLKYEHLFGILEVLLEGCNLDQVEGYSEHVHQDDIIPLIIYSMGLAVLAMEVLHSIHGDLKYA